MTTSSAVGRRVALGGGNGVQRRVNLSVLVGLWLSILAALAGSPASARAAAAHAGRAAESSVRRSERGPIHEALHRSHVVTGVASATRASATRASATRASAATHPAPWAAVASAPQLADAPREIGRARALHVSHAVAARGTVLPYFATAPPLQG
jgi:hypothetical protein